MPAVPTAPLRQRIFYGWVMVATLAVVNFAVQATGTLNLGLFIVPMSDDLGISRSVFGCKCPQRPYLGSLPGISTLHPCGRSFRSVSSRSSS